MKLNIAIVDDETEYAELVRSYLKRFAEEQRLSVSVTLFQNALLFLDQYTGAFDLVFMDIRMPYLNGMDAAHRLRELDESVLLIFLTNLSQYAISGYEVDALDYILKPVRYYDFTLKMTRALKRLRTSREPCLLLPTDRGTVSLAPSELYYVETMNHHLIYHTQRGDFTQYSSLKEAEGQLPAEDFARCNSCYLVNLRYVSAVQGYTVTLPCGELRISQPRKKSFLAQWSAWLNRKADGGKDG